MNEFKTIIENSSLKNFLYEISGNKIKINNEISTVETNIKNSTIEINNIEKISSNNAKVENILNLNQINIHTDEKISATRKVISTLNLNELKKKSGTWNIKKINLKNSFITKFDGRLVIKSVYKKIQVLLNILE